MSKKILSIFMVIIMVSALLPVSSFAENDILSYLTYKIKNNEVYISDCDRSISGDVVIPAEIDGLPVTELGSAFMYCDGITSIVIPDSVKVIDECTFTDCTQLKTVKLSSGLTKVEQFLFTNCTSLESIEIPDNVTNIGLAAFNGCSNLKTIKVGKGVSDFDTTAYLSCPSLERFIVDAENLYYSSDDNGALFDKDKTTLFFYPSANTSATYTVPESVVTIFDNAFTSCNYLKNIEISESVERVYGRISGSSLEKITFYNKNCVIDFESQTIPESVVIYGYTDSVAEQYAERFNRKFIALDNDIISVFIRFVKSYIDLIMTLIKNVLKMF